MPGPSSATSMTPRRRRRARGAARCWRPAGVWRTALSSRLRTIRCSSSGLPSTGIGRSVLDAQLAVADHRRHLGRRVPAISAEVAAAALAEAAGVGPRQQQQVGDEAAHPPRGAKRRIDHLAVLGLPGPSSEACSSSRFAITLVSGVRSSCEASATNSRCFCIARRARPRRSSAREHLVQGAGQLADLVLDCRLRHPPGGVARRRDLAGGAVNDAIGRIARLAIASPASVASRVPPSTPASMNSQRRRSSNRSLRAAPVLDVAGHAPV